MTPGSKQTEVLCMCTKILKNILHTYFLFTGQQKIKVRLSLSLYVCGYITIQITTKLDFYYFHLKSHISKQLLLQKKLKGLIKGIEGG